MHTRSFYIDALLHRIFVFVVFVFSYDFFLDIYFVYPLIQKVKATSRFDFYIFLMKVKVCNKLNKLISK